MKVPEIHLCDVAGCPDEASYRILHVLLAPLFRSTRQTVVTFEFCEFHASDFSINARGAWQTKHKLRSGVPQ